MQLGERLGGFAGLFSRRSESGGQDNPSQRIAKGGNNRLKRDLILAADIARSSIQPSLRSIMK